MKKKDTAPNSRARKRLPLDSGFRMGDPYSVFKYGNDKIQLQSITKQMSFSQDSVHSSKTFSGSWQSLKTSPQPTRSSNAPSDSLSFSQYFLIFIIHSRKEYEIQQGYVTSLLNNSPGVIWRAVHTLINSLSRHKSIKSELLSRSQ